MLKKLSFICLLFLNFDSMAQEYSIDLFCQDLNVVFHKLQITQRNIANINTTRTIEGGPYKRRYIGDCKNGVCKEFVDNKPPLFKYDPAHPDANREGYVAYPGYVLEQEQADLLKIKLAYKLITHNTPTGFSSKDLLVGSKFDDCFEKYAFVKDAWDFKSFLGR